MKDAAGKGNLKQSVAVASKAWIVAGAVWLALVGAGTLGMVRYAQSLGAAANAPLRWPGESKIVISSEVPTLLMFVHPRCPCSRASLGELHRLVTSGRGGLKAQVWFVQPPGLTEEWAQTDLWRQALSMPGVVAAVDRDGREAGRFGAATSGHCVLYGPDGMLWFQGGITQARGHAGDSAGRAAVLALLERKSTEPLKAAVFGCELCEKGESQ